MNDDDLTPVDLIGVRGELEEKLVGCCVNVIFCKHDNTKDLGYNMKVFDNVLRDCQLFGCYDIFFKSFKYYKVGCVEWNKRK